VESQVSREHDGAKTEVRPVGVSSGVRVLDNEPAERAPRFKSWKRAIAFGVAGTVHFGVRREDRRAIFAGMAAAF